MIYIVSGYVRHGTSAMMLALRTGGLTVDYDLRRDEQIKAARDDEHFAVNAGGLFELSRAQVSSPDFPAAHEGHCIKQLRSGLTNLRARSASDPYRVCFMRRDYEETRQSQEAALGVRQSVEQIRHVVEHCLGIAYARSDMRVTEVWYERLRENPEREMLRLAVAGWPIDPCRAASVIDRRQARFVRGVIESGA